MTRKQLTDRTVAALKPRPGERLTLADGVVPGLAIRVNATSKTWTLTYRVGRRQRRWTIGAYQSIGVADARKRARRALNGLADGVDPAAAKMDAREGRTFAELADAYVKHAQKKKRSWMQDEGALRRVRRDVGDLSDLKVSMEAIGLLHPIVLNERGKLIAGERRLRAARELGWKTVPVRVVRDLDDAVRVLAAERDENTCRKDFLPSEAVALARDLEPFERKAAVERKAIPNTERAKLAPSEKGKTRDKIAAAVGVPRSTLAKAEKVVEAAEREPERFQKLRDQMDRTGNVHGAFKQLEKQQQADSINAEPPPLPAGPFRVIVADPPWQYDVRANDVTHRSNLPYPEMSIDAICALPVADLAADDCVLWLWTTNAHMRESYVVLDAWGFASKTILTWAKDRFGVGNWLRGQTEHCHLAIRGKPTVVLTNQSTLLAAPLGPHSAKPDAFYDLVCALCPGARVELFARRERPGFISIAIGLQVVLLTAQRNGEVFTMQTSDVDLDEGWWTIPETISKNHQAHRVPLVPRVVELLRAAQELAPDHNRYVFAGDKGASVAARANKAIRALRLAQAITFECRRHDLRRTAATNMAKAGIPRETIAKVLNHVDRGSRATTVYDRHTYDAEKRVALETWARRLESILAPKADAAHVVPFTREKGAAISTIA